MTTSLWVCQEPSQTHWLPRTSRKKREKNTLVPHHCYSAIPFGPQPQMHDFTSSWKQSNWIMLVSSPLPWQIGPSQTYALNNWTRHIASCVDLEWVIPEWKKYRQTENDEWGNVVLKPVPPLQPLEIFCLCVSDKKEKVKKERKMWKRKGNKKKEIVIDSNSIYTCYFYKYAN